MKPEVVIRKYFLVGLTGCLLWTVSAIADSTTDYKIAPQDMIVVDVYGERDLSKELKVSEGGEITMHLLGSLKVSGMTASQAEKHIKELLAKDYIRDPQVIVAVKNYRKRMISVFGQVSRPGLIDLPAEQEMTVIEAVAAAGGFTRLAQEEVHIMRANDAKATKFTLKQLNRNAMDPTKRFVLQPGDSLFVPERNW
jgi:polysaccharide export outer membrane protein